MNHINLAIYFIVSILLVFLIYVPCSLSGVDKNLALSVTYFFVSIPIVITLINVFTLTFYNLDLGKVRYTKFICLHSSKLTKQKKIWGVASLVLAFFIFVLPVYIIGIALADKHEEMMLFHDIKKTELEIKELRSKILGKDDTANGLE